MKMNQRIMRIALAAFFLVMLFPLWGHLFPQPEVESLEENRAMTEWFFSGTLKNRIGTLEDYLNDHLAFRQSAISAVLRANLALGESPHELVASGLDGWLFYMTGTEDLRNGGIIEEDIFQELYGTQQAISDTFAAAGADYRILLAPDKSTVYPRYLPLSCRMGSGPSFVDQMLTAPGPEYSVRFIDVRPALIRAAEGDSPQYYKTDTHWNTNGALTACLALIDDLLPEHPSIRRLTEADLIYGEETFSGDLAAMIGQKGIMTDRYTGVSVRDTSFRKDPDRSDGTFTVMVNDALPDAPRLLLIHDSFGNALVPFLRECFSEVWLMSNDGASFAAMGDLSRFDIVVYELVERNRSWLWTGISGGPGEDGEDYDDEYDEYDDEYYDEYDGYDEDDESFGEYGE